MTRGPLEGPRLRVDPLACDAHGVCMQAFPEMIGSDSWGYPLLAPGPVPAQLIKHARRAVSLCPTLALRLEAVEAPGS